MKLPGPDGIAVTQILRAEQNAPGVVIHSMHDDAEMRERAHAAGALAFVGKHEGIAALLSAIRKAAAQPSNPQKHSRSEFENEGNLFLCENRMTDTNPLIQNLLLAEPLRAPIPLRRLLKLYSYRPLAAASMSGAASALSTSGDDGATAGLILQPGSFGFDQGEDLNIEPLQASHIRECSALLMQAYNGAPSENHWSIDTAETYLKEFTSNPR